MSKTRIQKSKPSVITDSLSMYDGRYLSDNSYVHIMVSHQIVWYLILSEFLRLTFACYLSLLCPENILRALRCEA